MPLLEDMLVDAKQMAYEEMLNEKNRNISNEVSISFLVSPNIPIEKDRVYHWKKARHENKYY